MYNVILLETTVLSVMGFKIKLTTYSLVYHERGNEDPFEFSFQVTSIKLSSLLSHLNTHQKIRAFSFYLKAYKDPFKSNTAFITY